MKTFVSIWLFSLLCRNAIAAITIDVTNPDSIKQAAAKAAAGMTQYYTGNKPGDVPGNLPDPYYWWEAGAMFGALIDYWYFTGDDQYNNMTMQAMLHQAGPDADFMPLNQTRTLGNDDQAFWGMAALSAAENKFPNPPSDQPQWLALAQAVFNTQASRWDDTTCAGGLRWQIFQFNAGYNYKNSISNGCFFNIAARLAMYTGNQTYADWAVKMWDWVEVIGLLDKSFNVFDGSDDTLNCTQIDHIQWSYNAGTFLVGAANMYNLTGGSQIWADRINGIISRMTQVFFENGVMVESACETIGTCDVDQRSFKAYLSRWMSATATRAPFTYPLLKPLLETSAQAAAATCTGGSDGNQCGLRWSTRQFGDPEHPSVDPTGVGEMMAALEVFQSNLINYVEGPVTVETGGISQGDPNAGQRSPIGPGDLNKSQITTADRVGAAVLTVFVVVSFVSTMWWMVS